MVMNDDKKRRTEKKQSLVEYKGISVSKSDWTCFILMLFQGSTLYTIVFMRLFIRILFDATYRNERQIWTFLKLVGNSNLLKKCRWIEMNCGGAELGIYN